MIPEFQGPQARERNKNRKLVSLFQSKKKWGSAEELAPIEEERTASNQLALPAFRPRKFSRWGETDTISDSASSPALTHPLKPYIHINYTHNVNLNAYVMCTHTHHSYLCLPKQSHTFADAPKRLIQVLNADALTVNRRCCRWCYATINIYANHTSISWSLYILMNVANSYLCLTI